MLHRCKWLMRRLSGTRRTGAWQRRVISLALVSLLIVLTRGLTHAARTGTMGLNEGAEATVDCPNNLYLAGFAVWHSVGFSGLMPYCANMGDDGSWNDGAKVYMDIQMSQVKSGAWRRNLLCPQDFYLYSFRGLSDVTGIHSIVQFTLECKNVKQPNLTATIATENVDFATTQWRGAQCENNTVATGVFGRTNINIIQFGLSCTQTRPAMLMAAKLRTSTQQGPPILQQLSPTIVAPAMRQQFFSQSPVAIKLAPPKGLNVTAYTVNLQRMNSAGQWLAHGTIPVGAAQAHSSQGYTGFGAGAPPTYLSVPGAWRLNAQISSPQQSGWSDWLEFQVMAPPTPTNALKPGVKIR